MLLNQLSVKGGVAHPDPRLLINLWASPSPVLGPKKLIFQTWPHLLGPTYCSEVNTSGFSHRGEQYPARGILEEAIALGVPLVAGSDAHRPSEVGRHFERVR